MQLLTTERLAEHSPVNEVRRPRVQNDSEETEYDLTVLGQAISGGSKGGKTRVRQCVTSVQGMDVMNTCFRTSHIS